MHTGKKWLSNVKIKTDMPKLEIKLNEPFVILPLKEYEYLKSIVGKIGAKIDSNENSDFLTTAQIKHFNEIEEKYFER